jgi:hypothetical protein
MVASQLNRPAFCYYVVTRCPTLWNDEGKPEKNAPSQRVAKGVG